MKFTIYKKLTYNNATHAIEPRWRWRLKGSNGRIIAASSQAFSSKQSAKRNARLTRDRLAAITPRQWWLS